MTIEDIIRLLSGGGSVPTQNTQNPQDPQTAPALANATAAVEGPPQPPAQATSTPVLTPAMPVGNTIPPANQQAPAPGILNRLVDSSKGVSPIEHLLRGFTAAGSSDPAKAMAQFYAQDSEDTKNKLAMMKATRGETKHIAGALFGVYGPDGTLQRTFVDPTAGKYENDKAARDAETATGKAVSQGVIQEMIKKQMGLFDDTVKEAGGATTKAEYDPSVAGKVSKLDAIIMKIPDVNTIKGTPVGDIQSPVLASIVDNTYGRIANTDAYKTRRDLEAYYTKDVLADVKKLGANPSNADREFIAKPIPKSDDPIAYQLEYAKEMRDRLHEAETRRVAAAQQRDAAATTSTVANSRSTPAANAAPAPAPTEAIRSAVTAAGIAFEPEKYQYRIGPNGQVQRKAK